LTRSLKHHSDESYYLYETLSDERGEHLMAETTEVTPTVAGAGDPLLRAVWRQALIAAALAVGTVLLASAIPTTC